MSNITWSIEEENKLRVLYDDGYLAKDIAEILNKEFHNGIEKRNKNNVRQKACRLGIKSKFYRKEVNGLFYCSHCKTYKEKSEFRSNAYNKKHGIGNLCFICDRVYQFNNKIKKKYGDVWNKFNSMKEEE